MKRKTGMQNKFKNKKFGYDQYWKMYYVLLNHDGSEDKFISVIKARSLEFAKKILEAKIKQKDEGQKIKNINGFMFHKGFLNKDGSMLSIGDWENIRQCSFPNENDFLFQYHIEHLSSQDVLEKNELKIRNLHE